MEPQAFEALTADEAHMEGGPLQSARYMPVSFEVTAPFFPAVPACQCIAVTGRCSPFGLKAACSDQTEWAACNSSLCICTCAGHDGAHAKMRCQPAGLQGRAALALPAVQARVQLHAALQQPALLPVLRHCARAAAAALLPACARPATRVICRNMSLSAAMLGVVLHVSRVLSC